MASAIAALSGVNICAGVRALERLINEEVLSKVDFTISPKCKPEHSPFPLNTPKPQPLQIGKTKLAKDKFVVKGKVDLACSPLARHEQMLTT